MGYKLFFNLPEDEKQFTKAFTRFSLFDVILKKNETDSATITCNQECHD